MGSIALDSKLSMSPLRHEAAGGASTNPTPSEAGSSNQASTIYEEGSEMCAAAAVQPTSPTGVAQRAARRDDVAARSVCAVGATHCGASPRAAHGPATVAARRVA